jgi:hypothetical protein
VLFSDSEVGNNNLKNINLKQCFSSMDVVPLCSAVTQSLLCRLLIAFQGKHCYSLLTVTPIEHNFMSSITEHILCLSSVTKVIEHNFWSGSHDINY